MFRSKNHRKRRLGSLFRNAAVLTDLTNSRMVGNPEVITGTIYPPRNSVAAAAVKQSTSAAVLRQPRDRRDSDERPLA